jgi:hypothetical protein
MSSAAQETVAAPAYERRGRTVEAHRDGMQRRIQQIRAALLDTLRASAPGLVSRVDAAAPPVPEGYQLLPRLVPDPPALGDSTRRAALYSWPWTDTLIERATSRMDTLEAVLAASTKTRETYVGLVERFNGAVADRRLIDAHIEHNWFWQRAIAVDSPRFSRATEMIAASLRGTGTPLLNPPAMPRVQMVLGDSGSGPVTIRIPVATDIDDTAFVRAARSIIEQLWTVSMNGRLYRLQLDVRFFSPRMLYCLDSNSGCAPPRRGGAIDLPSHVARFPADLAVLTTGGTQPHVLGGRSMILGPRDLTFRTLAHEFGHVLGFDDAYLRGYRSLGNDGFAIIELIPDPGDLMASSGIGSALPRHFVQLVANLRAERAMKAGLAALYDKGNARDAVLLFREVLDNRADHYGANFQLAKALDQSGDSAAAVVVWRRVLDMARGAGDSTTAAVATVRLRVP